ncbi:MAG TPA: RNA polymerase sigma factor [Chthonomonadaceae bacterium]|nr:RNA polymerase sigma factor [Chthonomonadaceae bacterium]
MNTPSVASPRPRENDCPVGPFHHDVDLPHVLRAREGDRSALTPLWEKYHPSLIHYFDRRTQNPEDAEDLASETLCAAFSQLSAFRGKSASPSTLPHASTESRRAHATSCTFRSYLFAIAHNQMTQWIRRKTTRSTATFTECESVDRDASQDASLPDRLAADPDADPLQILLSREKDDAACYALADIGMRSEDQFKAILLHYACDLPHKEIALLLRTPQKTINSRLQEARESIRKRFEMVHAERMGLPN